MRPGAALRAESAFGAFPQELGVQTFPRLFQPPADPPVSAPPTRDVGAASRAPPPPEGRGLSTQLILLRPERAQGRPRSRLWFCCSDRKGKWAITSARSPNVSSLLSEGHSYVIVKGKQHTGIVFKGKQPFPICQ